MAIRLSYIVPVYNCERYLSRCVDSILQQGLSEDEFEILLINDGSSDNSLEVAQSYSQRHKNIKVLSHDNHGVSFTRNVGIDKALGTYITFVDADDYLTGGTVPSLLSKAEAAKLDVLCAFMNVELSDGRFARSGCLKLEKNKVFNNEQYLYGGGDISSVCSSLISTKLLRDNHLHFDEDLAYGEDTMFCCWMYAYSERIMWVDDAMYVYKYNGESASREMTTEQRSRKLKDTILMTKYQMELGRSWKGPAAVGQFFVKRAYTASFFLIFNNMKSNSLSAGEFDKMVDKLRSYSCYPIKGSVFPNKLTPLAHLLNISFVLNALKRTFL